MSGDMTSGEKPVAEKQIAVQFFCTNEEYASIKAASEKEMRSMASFAKFYTIKTANAIAGKAI